MYNFVQNVYNYFLPKDEIESHHSSENFFNDRVKLTYDRALNELATSFFNMNENLDLVKQLVEDNDFNPLSRKLISVALDKIEGHIYVQINNPHVNTDADQTGILYKSHFENDQIIWEVFCNVVFVGGRIYVSIERERGRFQQVVEKFMALDEKYAIEIDSQPALFKIHDLATQRYKKFYPIDKCASLYSEDCSIKGAEDDERGSPLLTKINMEHIKECILSKKSYTKSARKLI